MYKDRLFIFIFQLKDNTNVINLKNQKNKKTILWKYTIKIWFKILSKLFIILAKIKALLNHYYQKHIINLNRSVYIFN